MPIRHQVSVPHPARLATRACLALFAVASIGFVLWPVHPFGPSWLLWVTMPGYGPLLAALFRLLARNDDLPGPTRDFWRRLTPVPLLVGAAQTAQAVDVLGHPEVRTSYTGALTLTLNGIALLVLCYALIRLPAAGRQVGAAARVALDAGTVALASAVFIWHFGTRQALGAGFTPAVAASLGLCVVAVLAVFALVKAVLGEYSALDARGLRLLAAAVFIGALAPMLQPLAVDLDPQLYVAQVHLPAVFCLGAMAAEAQWRSPVAARSRKRRRPYSLLPYAAVAAVDGLLLWSAVFDRSDMIAVAFSAVLLTALVATRQASTLRDNARLLAELDHAATHDALTGLANRALFQQRLKQALHDGPAQVAMLDMDGFKQVNDTYGHEAGDLLLATVAGVLSVAARPGDTAARLGGDEFVLLLPGTDDTTATAVVEQIIAALAAPVPSRGTHLHIRVSIGLATAAPGDDPLTVMRHADQAMYAAKKVPGTAWLAAA
jgi:diguanylate cyclase (GGDEF)-like protein